MRITVATTFETWPAMSGASLRNFHLYKAIARRNPVSIVALSKKSAGEWDAEIAPGLHEQRISISDDHLNEELKVCALADGRPVGDFAAALLWPLTPRFELALRRSCKNADILVASHPYLFRALRACSAKPLVYEAPDVEIDLKRSHLPHTLDGLQLLNNIARNEALCLAEAELVLAVNERDRNQFIEAYGVSPDKIVIARNGADVEGIPFQPWNARKMARRSRAMPWHPDSRRKTTCLFLASWGGPNDEAAEYVVDLAKRMPDVRFIIAGSIVHHLADHSVSANVTLWPDISEAKKLKLLKSADIALNPVLGGSGDNIKIAEYGCAGPVILTTPFGVRGYPPEVSSAMLVRDLDQFEAAIREVECQTDHGEIAMRTSAVRRWLEANRGWSHVGEDVGEALREVALKGTRRSRADGQLVSVLVPMKNAAPWIDDCLASILAQSHTKLEVVVVDDGSTDGSRAQVLDVAARDPRVRLVHHLEGANCGVNRSLELGLQHATGPYVALCDADDLWLATKLERQLAVLDDQPDAVMCHTATEVFGDVSQRLIDDAQAHFGRRPSAPTYRLLDEPDGLAMMRILNSGTLIRAAPFRRTPFGANQAYQSEDHLIMIMLSASGLFAYLDEPLVRYRLHHDSYTSRTLTRINTDLFSRLEMLLVLITRVEDSEWVAKIQAQIDATLWLMKTHYQGEAPDLSAKLRSLTWKTSFWGP